MGPSEKLVWPSIDKIAHKLTGLGRYDSQVGRHVNRQENIIINVSFDILGQQFFSDFKPCGIWENCKRIMISTI